MRTNPARRAVLAALGALLLFPATPSSGSTPAPVTIGTPMRSPAGDLPTGPRPNGTAVLPDGRFVTPVGTTAQVDLLPLNVVLSHDGRRLYVSSEGGDDDPGPSGEDGYDRYISVLDTTSMERTRLDDDALQYGLAESPDGRELWVSEGETGTVGVFRLAPDGTARRDGEVALESEDFPWGLTLSPDGRHAYVAGFRGNALSIIDTASRRVVSRVGTGEFPYTVALSPDGTTAYVSNWGLYNAEADPVVGQGPSAPADPPPATVGGYNTDRSSSVWFYDVSDPANPSVIHKVRIGADIDGYDVLSGSLPSSLAVSPDGATLAVTASNHDLVVLLDAATGATRRVVDLRPIAGGPTGAQPNALAWAPDGSVLYVAEGGRNDVALIDPDAGTVTGRLPTGWYPSAVAVSRDGRQLFVASAKGLGAGPNADQDEPHPNQSGHNASYIGNLLDGLVQRIDLAAACRDLPRLSHVVDRNNGMVPAEPDEQQSVVPSAYGQGPSDAIGHVVFVLKENRTYDQIFGDLAGTERDERLAFYGNPVTPNHHEAATRFAHGDNYYDVGQDSFDGHFIIDTGHENEFDQKVHPTVWNADKLGPEGLYVSAPENLPMGGFMWNGLYRHGVSFRIYGEATYLLGLGPTTLVPPDPFAAAGGSPQQVLPQAYALQGNYSLTYPSQITPSRPAFGSGTTDEDRADDFLRDLQTMEATGRMPQFLFLWLTDDHTQGTTPGQPTPETMVARNDHAMGRILEGLTHSRFWDDMAVFVTEDDPQDGQDHVDAHRTVQLVLSPYAKRGSVIRTHHSNLSTLKTMNLLLGVPPTSLQEATATSLADYFQDRPELEPRFDAVPTQIEPATNPTAEQAANPTLAAAARLAARIPDGLDEGGELMQEALRLRHEGAVAAGDPAAPATRDVQEHHLASGAPPAVRLPAAGGDADIGACAGRTEGPSDGRTEGAGSGHGAGAPAGVSAAAALPTTGGSAPLTAAGIGALALALAGSPRRRRIRGRAPDGPRVPPAPADR